jgi:membrane fusion protein, multidrug efflux system
MRALNNVQYKFKPAAAAQFMPLLILVIFAGCKKKVGPVEQPPPLVTIAEATTQDVPFYIDEIGTCTSPQSVSIRPQASGQITQMNFKDGDYLKIGDKLFTIDPRPYQQALGPVNK